ncbi:1-aminocyclopropane-1-carboxylate deaminase/D-cysteine desulfhydrase [Paraglaciecola hydrolytica]
MDWPNPHHCLLNIKRDDLIHPIISGNKWRKLKYSLCHALENDCSHIVSFGGGFSNHLHALAYCCKQLNIKFTAIVRGDYRANPSPMLQDLSQWQSDIHYVDKLTYQRREKPEYLALLQKEYPDAMIIPEGGSNTLALQGVAEIVNELSGHYDYIVAPVASGATLAGLIHATHQTSCKILGIGVLKGEGYLEELVQQLLPQSYGHWSINHEYHCGGYAKSNIELRDFCRDFYQQTQVDIEPVYSGKLFFALRHLIQQAYFPVNSRILALHTGGLQGAR